MRCAAGEAGKMLGMNMKQKRLFCRILGAALWAFPASAIAGPPYRTDDPEPVELQHWEFYTFTTGTHVTGDTSGVGPAFEFNYGIIPNGQLHIVAPTAFDSPAGGPTLFGFGDTELGFKYRFIEEEKDGARPQVGIFPMLEIPSGNHDRGLGAGYNFNKNDTFGDKDYWFFGWLLQKKITDKLTLGAEIFHQTANTVDGVDSTGFNFGGSYDFDEHNHLLFSAGRGFQNASATNLYSWYLGWQITY
jgi:hypothetical protein